MPLERFAPKAICERDFAYPKTLSRRGRGAKITNAAYPIWQDITHTASLLASPFLPVSHLRLLFIVFFQKGFKEADRHSEMLSRHAFIDLMGFAPLLRL